MQTHSLTPSFRSFPDELNTLFNSLDLPVTICVILTADVWGHEYSLSTGEMTIHRLEDTRLSNIPTDLHCNLFDRVTAMPEQDYQSEVPINVKNITVKVGLLSCIRILARLIVFSLVFYQLFKLRLSLSGICKARVASILFNFFA